MFIYFQCFFFKNKQFIGYFTIYKKKKLNIDTNETEKLIESTKNLVFEIVQKKTTKNNTIY